MIALAQAMQSTASGYGIGEPGEASHERELTPAESSTIVEDFIRDLAGDEDPDLTEELLESRLFLLMPTGTPAHPSWDALAVADLSRPAARRVEAELAQQLREFRENAPDDNDEWSDAFDEWQELVAPRALFPPDGMWPGARRRARRVMPTGFAPYAVFSVVAEDLRGHELTGAIDFGVDVVDLDQDPRAATLQYVSQIADALERGLYTADVEPLAALAEAFRTDGGRRRKPGDPASDAVSESIESWVSSSATELSDLANDYLAKMLPDAPEVLLAVNPPAIRFARPGVEWAFGPARLSLEDLSRAEQQWATRAINHALYWHRRELTQSTTALRPIITMIDEPEAALHRAAESQMAGSLVSLAEDPRQIIITATHSPELLDTPAAHVIEVQRGGGMLPGRSLVQTLDLADRDSLNRLGLAPSDLLRWPRYPSRRRRSRRGRVGRIRRHPTPCGPRHGSGYGRRAQAGFHARQPGPLLPHESASRRVVGQPTRRGGPVHLAASPGGCGSRRAPSRHRHRRGRHREGDARSRLCAELVDACARKGSGRTDPTDRPRACGHCRVSAR